MHLSRYIRIDYNLYEANPYLEKLTKSYLRCLNMVKTKSLEEADWKGTATNGSNPTPAPTKSLFTAILHYQEKMVWYGNGNWNRD